MRTGQKVRVQSGTGPGSGGGRRGQTVHVRAPGGGALFEHGVVLNGDTSGETVYLPATWDTDGYYAEDSANYPYGITIPTGLGGIYLVVGAQEFTVSGSPSSGFAIFGLRTSAGVGWMLSQTQLGYRSAATLAAAEAPQVNFAWIGELSDGETVRIGAQSSIGGGGINTTSGNRNLSAFRLGDVGEAGFHGALTYVDTEFGGSPYFDRIFGPMLFDTDDYASTFNRLAIPARLGGLYVMCASRRFRVASTLAWQAALPYYPFGRDFGQIPIMLGDVIDPPDAGDGYPSRMTIAGVDINDCEAGANKVSVTSFWVGRLRELDRVEVLNVSNASGNPPSPIITDMDAAMTYLALVRIAP